MLRQKPKTFQRELLRAILLYALAPTAVLSLLLLLGVWGFGKQNLVRGTHADLEQARQAIETLMESYRKQLDRLSAAYDPETFDESAARVAAMQAMYRAQHGVGLHPSIYFLDDEQAVKYTTERRSEVERFIVAYVESSQQQLKKPGALKRLYYVVAGSETESDLFPQVLLLQRGRHDRGWVLFSLPTARLLSLVTRQSGVHLQLTTTSGRNLAQMKGRWDSNAWAAIPAFWKTRLSYVAEMPMLEGQMRIIGENHLEPLVYMMLSLLAFVSVLMLSLGGVVAVLARRMSARRAAMIPVLQQGFAALETGDYTTRIHLETGDEFEQITASFNRMVENLQQYEQNKSQIQKEKLIAHLQAYTAQLHPHFLFNTLESLRFLIMLDPERAVMMVQALSHLLRYVTNIEQDVVTLQDECALLAQYVSIFQIRLGDRLHFAIRCPSELADVNIPKMLLQPLVENAIGHNQNEVEQLEIEVRIAQEAGGIGIEVRDNGSGMDEIQVAELMEAVQAEDYDGRSVGLRNVVRRLIGYFGSSARLEIAAGEGHGTRIHLWIPAGGEHV